MRRGEPLRSSPEDPGRAIELRLQAYRFLVHVGRPLEAWPEGDPETGLRANLEALRWLEALSSSGHWGATLILRRVAADTPLAGQVAVADPDAAMRLARLSRQSAYQAALAEVRRDSPDWARLREWMELADQVFLAAAIGAAQRVCGGLEARDLECVRTAFSERTKMEVLNDMAEWRQASGDPGHRAQVEPLVEAAARLGSRRARRMLLARDWAAAADRAALAESWCARYERHVPAKEVRSLLRAGAPLSDAELDRVKAALDDGLGEHGALLLQVAGDRHRAGGNPEAVGALLAAAAGIAGRPELESLWQALWARAPDRRALLDWWLERFTDLTPNKKQAFLVGLWIEKSAPLGDDERLALAAQWYARAKDVRLEPGASLPGSLCYFASAYMNPHVSFRFAEEAELSRAWLERGIAVGSDTCLDTWLKACAQGQLGIAQDPDLAMDRVRRVMQVRPGDADPLRGYTIGLSALVARAEALLSGKDEEAARRWLRVAAEARYPKAIERLASLK
jgi:hypothetical protein